MVRIVVGPVLDEEVSRLNIAVHQPMAVRSVEGTSRLADHGQRFGRREAVAFPEHPAQVSAGHIAHGYVEQRPG